jgi:hypothetical protein
VPVLHGSLPFSLAVREAFAREQPDCVAVELPETMSAALERVVQRLPLLSVLRYPVAEGPAFLLIEPSDPIIEAIRLARERQLPWHPIDRDCDAYPSQHDRVPDPHAVERIGYRAYVDKVAQTLASAPRSPEDELREKTMAFHLRRLLERHQKVLFVCGLAHVERVRALVDAPVARPIGRTKRADVQLFHLHEDSSREVLSEPGYVQGLYEQWRAAPPAGAAPPAALSDRYKLLRQLLLAARDRMEREDGERMPARALRIGLQFARNQALARGGLAADLYELTIAARGVGSDDFAWHVWDLGVTYPYQSANPDLPAYRLTLDELHHGKKRLWFRRRLKTRRHALRLVRPRKKEPAPGEWGDRFHEPSICSYPPEDVRVEGYGEYLKKKGKSLLASERARVAPFLSGLGEGIDLRETIKNWAHDGRLYVREEQAASAAVGAVCVIFDAEDQQNRYSYTVTWQGEHEDESDMALYATPPSAHVVGPKIGRCEYGGFLMTYPPGRMFHVFEDAYFDAARTKAERLLYAAIDYSIERCIVYVAARPPPRRVSSFAGRTGKHVLFVPLGQLSPATLRKIRIFHVLEGRAVRDYAADYIGP